MNKKSIIALLFVFCGPLFVHANTLYLENLSGGKVTAIANGGKEQVIESNVRIALGSYFPGQPGYVSNLLVKGLKKNNLFSAFFTQSISLTTQLSQLRQKYDGWCKKDKKWCGASAVLSIGAYNSNTSGWPIKVRWEKPGLGHLTFDV